MAQFDSRKAYTQKIAPEQLKELKIFNGLKLVSGGTYTGTKGDKRILTRLIVPAFSKTAETTIVAAGHNMDGTEYQIYHTPNAFGPACVIGFIDEKGEHGSCSPSEFKKWMDVEKPVEETESPVVPGFKTKVDQAEATMIKRQAERNKDVKIMPDIK